MEEPNEVIDTNYIEKLEKHIESTKSNIKYSIDRFDILIIAICSGGLVFSLNFVKNILVSKVGCDFILVKISWISFGLSIIINLFSQVTSYIANDLELKITRSIIKQEKKKIEINLDKQEKNKNIMNNLTLIFNIISLMLLVLGVLLLIIFMIIT